MLGIKKPLTKGSEVFAVMEVVTLRNTALQQGQPLIIDQLHAIIEEETRWLLSSADVIQLLETIQSTVCMLSIVKQLLAATDRRSSFNGYYYIPCD